MAERPHLRHAALVLLLTGLLTVPLVAGRRGYASPGTVAMGLVLLAACAALVILPRVDVLWRIPPATVMCAGLVLGMFSGNWGALGLPAKIAPDRVLILFAVAGALLGAPEVARRCRPRLDGSHALLAAAALWAMASALAAGTLMSGGFRLLDRFGIAAFLVYLAAPIMFRTPAARRLLLWTLVGMGWYLGLTAVFEIAGPHALVVPGYITDPSVGIHFGRARGPFVEAATNGMALFTCGVAAVIAAQLPGLSRPGRALAAGAVVVCVVGLVLTLQRTAWIGALAAILIVLLRRRELRPLLLPATAGLLALVAVVLVAIPGFAERAQARKDNQETLWDRRNLAHAATAMATAHPLTGVGWNRFTDVSRMYFWQLDDIPLTGARRIPHNAALANAAELGVPGALLWLVALAGAVLTALRARVPPGARIWQDGLLALAVFVVALILFTPLLQPWPLLALLLVAGVVRAQASRPPFEEPA